ncbi:MAG TPA: NADH-quinone oxidoreductase subunit N, partial [Longimicrobium sp.]|nr:NADH-quinone oxidoreductase subunit N [Longimicrobium sp.]
MFADLFRSLGRPDVLDLARQSHYFWALLPEIVVALGAMGVLMVDVFQKGNRSEPSRPNVAWLSVLTLVLAAVANLALVDVADRSDVGMVAMDNFRMITNFIYLGSSALAIFLSMGYLDRRGINRGEFHVLVLFATLGMMLMGGARDLMLLFVGLEVMSVAIYVLVGFDRLDPRSSEGSLKYFLLGAFSSAFFLYGLALVWGTVGTTNLRGISQAVIGGAAPFGAIFLAGMALTMVGFAFKVAAMPFHMWTPDAYDGAPTPVTALMSTGVKAAAFASFIRVFIIGFGGARPEWGHPVFFLAVATMFGANLVALTQGSVKRMLAYSSIAHAGYLLVALLAGNQAGVAAFLFYLVVYTIMTAGAFGIVIANSREDGEERVALEDWAGFASQKPLMAALFSIFLLSLAGFPLTAGFLGKLYILRAAVESRNAPVAVLLVLASLISYFYYLRVIVVMYMRPARSADDHRHAWLPAPTRYAVVAAGVLVIGLFFFGSRPMRWAEAGAATLFRGGP